MTNDLLAVLAPEWDAALADSGIERASVRLYPFPGAPSQDGHAAYYFVPHQRLRHSEKFPDDLGAQLQDANEHTGHHRIVVWPADVEREVLGAYLRHELEHARQWEAHGQLLWDLNDLVLAVLGQRVNGLPRGGILYNLMPMETDANAASAHFAWQRYGEERCRALCDTDNGALFRSLTPPPPVETLPMRMLAFLFQFEDLARLLAERDQRTFEDILDQVWPGAATPWKDLLGLSLPPGKTEQETLAQGT